MCIRDRGNLDHIDQAVQITADAREFKRPFRLQVDMELFDERLFVKPP